MTASTPTTLLAPVSPSERLELLDIVRGVALLGILLMNIEAFVGPVFAATTGLDPTLTGADRIVDAAIYILVQGKFWCLFSLLFGMGFAVMSQRATASGRPFAGVYWRRGLVLLAIGLVHALLVWPGDILVTYALVSFALLAFRDVNGRWLVGVAVLCFLAPLGLMLLLGLIGTLMQSNPELAAQWKEAMQSTSGMIQAQREAYGAGSYAEATVQRLKDFVMVLGGLVMLGPMVLSMFLFGTWLVKSGAIAAPQDWSRLFQRLRWIALPVGLALVLASLALQPTIDQSEIDFTMAVAFCLGMIGSALMCFGYLGWIVRGTQTPATRRVLAWLAPAGRMALTNYLLQSVVCTLVFYGYGLGYFEQLPRAWQVPFVLALFSAQVLFSRWWLQRFRFGPMEWLWRSLTSLKPQPMRALHGPAGSAALQ